MDPENGRRSRTSDAAGRPHFWDNVRNSLIVVGSVVLASLVLAFLAALALARYRFYGKKAFVVVIFAVQMVPLVALIIPLFIALSAVGQVDRLTGVIVTYIALVLPFCVWTLRGFVAEFRRSSRRRRWSTARRVPAPSSESCCR